MKTGILIKKIGFAWCLIFKEWIFLPSLEIRDILVMQNVKVVKVVEYLIGDLFFSLRKLMLIGGFMKFYGPNCLNKWLDFAWSFVYSVQFKVKSGVVDCVGSSSCAGMGGWLCAKYWENWGEITQYFKKLRNCVIMKRWLGEAVA